MVFGLLINLSALMLTYIWKKLLQETLHEKIDREIILNFLIILKKASGRIPGDS